MSARQFNQDVSAAKRQAADGPLVITDRGVPAFVLLSIDDYRKLGEGDVDLVERLSMEDEDDLDVEPVRMGWTVPEL